MTCKIGDFDKHESDALIKIDAQQLTGWEHSCVIQGLKTNKTASALVRMSCVGEGEKFNIEQVWSLQKILGRELLVAYTPKSGFFNVKTKCEAVRVDGKTKEFPK